MQPVALAYDASPGCPSRDGFAAGLRARTDRLVVAPDASSPPRYRITLRPGPPATGHLETQDAEGNAVSRDLEGATCAEVGEALALVVAMDLDTPVAEAQGALPASAPAPPPSPALVPAPPLASVAPTASIKGERPVAPLSRDEDSWQLSANAGIAAGGSLVGPEAFIEATRMPAKHRGIALVVDGRIGASFEGSVFGSGSLGGASFSRTVGLLDVCPVRAELGSFSASACVRTEGGVLEASLASSASRPYVAAGAVAVGRWALAAPVFVQIEAGGVVPLVRDRFWSDEPVSLVYATPAVDAVGSAALGARFW